VDAEGGDAAPELRGDGAAWPPGYEPIALVALGADDAVAAADAPRTADGAGAAGGAIGGGTQADCGRGAGRAEGM